MSDVEYEPTNDFRQYLRVTLPELESSVCLSSNYFQILLNSAKPVNCYQLRFYFEDGKDLLKELGLRFLQHEAAFIIRSLFKTILANDITEGNLNFIKENGRIEDIVYDNLNKFYTPEPIDSINFSMDSSSFESSLWSKLETIFDEITVDIKHEGLINVNSPEYLKFLHILTWQSIFDGGSQFVIQHLGYELETDIIQLVNDGLYTNEVYDKTNSGRIGNNDPCVGKSGFSKDIVSVDRDRQFLQIFPRRSLFFPTTTLFLYLRQKLKLAAEEELSTFVSSLQAREELDYQLFGLKVQDRFTNEVITIKEVTKKRSEKVKISGTKTSVTQYYKDKYGARSDGRLPCVVSSGNKYYLLEHLTILDCQLYDKEGDDSDVYISSASTNVTGKKLITPSIKYGIEYIELDPNSFLPWNIRNRLHFIESAKKLTWGVINFNTILTNKKIQKFIENLAAFGKSLELDRPSRTDITSTEQFVSSSIEKLIAEHKEYDVLIFVVDTIRYKEFRKMLKFYEIGTNCITVCVSAIDANDNRPIPVIQKIMHKVNARTGGLNLKHIPRADESDGPIYNLMLIQEIMDSQYLMFRSQKWTPRLFIGLHWRQIDNNYMVGSIAYTINNNVIRGSYFILKTGLESFEPCEEALLEALLDYQKATQKSPSQIILFMQTTKFNSKMMVEYMKDAIQSVTIKYKSTNPEQKQPSFIVVNVQVDSGDALFLAPSSDVPKDTTELSVGTCVDQDVVDSRSFLLVQYRPAHASAIILPTRFTVFNEYPELITKKEIQYLTYYLCAIHPVECKMISLPLPLRAASDFTKRAFNNFHIYKKILSEMDEDDGAPQAKRSRIESMPDPFEDNIHEDLRVARLNRLLQPTSKNYYCA